MIGLDWLWPAPLWADLAVLGGAVALDLALPELPSALHPVRWMGRAITAMERLAPSVGAAPQLAAGACMALALPAVFGSAAALGSGFALESAGLAVYIALGAVLLKSTFTVRGLTAAARETAGLLASGDLKAARHSLRNLVSRDPSGLSAGQMAGAAVESVAENSTDSYIGPWFAFALFGLAGAFVYRAINTLDSMIGYRGRYEYLGKASARLDDLVNLIPARVSALLLLAAGAAQGLHAASGWRIMRRDHAETASPNAGWTMSAASGLLGVRLEKVGHYCLGKEFPEPAVSTISQANNLATKAALLGLTVAAVLLAMRHALTGPWL